MLGQPGQPYFCVGLLQAQGGEVGSYVLACAVQHAQKVPLACTDVSDAVQIAGGPLGASLVPVLRHPTMARYRPRGHYIPIESQ